MLQLGATFAGYPISLLHSAQPTQRLSNSTLSVATQRTRVASQCRQGHFTKTFRNGYDNEPATKSIKGAKS